MEWWAREHLNFLVSCSYRNVLVEKENGIDTVTTQAHQPWPQTLSCGVSPGWALPALSSLPRRPLRVHGGNDKWSAPLLQLLYRL